MNLTLTHVPGRTVRKLALNLTQPTWIHVALAAVAVTCLIQLPFLNEPMDLDQAVYFTVAASDSLPYVDALDHKPPLLYVWYKLALVLNGGAASEPAIRALMMLCLAGTTLSIFYIGKLAVSAAYGAIAAIIFSLLTANQFVLPGPTAESFGLLPLALSLLVFLYARRSNALPLAITAGVLAGAAAFTKTGFALPLILLVVMLLIDAKWKLAAGMMAGAIAIAIVTIVPWLLSGHLAEFWYANVTFNQKYGGITPFEYRPIAAFQAAMGAILGSFPVALLLVLAPFSKPIPASFTRLSGWWTLAGLMAVLLPGFTFTYYFAALFPGVSLLAAAAVLELRGRWQRVRWPVSAFFGLATAGSFLILLPIYIAGSQGSYDLKYPHVEGGALAYRLAPSLEKKLDPGDDIVVIGQIAQLYPLLDRQPPVRPVFTGFIIFDPGLLAPARRALEADPPKVIVQLKTPAGRDQLDLFVPSHLRSYRLVESHQHKGAVANVWLRD